MSGTVCTQPTLEPTLEPTPSRRLPRPKKSIRSTNHDNLLDFRGQSSVHAGTPAFHTVVRGKIHPYNPSACTLFGPKGRPGWCDPRAGGQ